LYYKLYIITYTEKRSPDRPDIYYYPQFREIYDEFGVTIIGGWINFDNPLEEYFLTAYRDKAHYDDFITQMKSHILYQELSKKIQPFFAETKVVNLDYNRYSPVFHGESDIEKYIQSMNKN